MSSNPDNGKNKDLSDLPFKNSGSPTGDMNLSNRETKSLPFLTPLNSLPSLNSLPHINNENVSNDLTDDDLPEFNLPSISKKTSPRKPLPQINDDIEDNTLGVDEVRIKARPLPEVPITENSFHPASPRLPVQ